MKVKRSWTWTGAAALAVAVLTGAFFLRMASNEGTENATSLRALAIDVTPAEHTTGFERVHRFVGRIEFAESAELGFELTGRLSRVLVDEGHRVTEGDTIAELDTDRLRAHRAELVSTRNEALARLELATLRDQRAIALQEQDVVAPQLADDARLERSAREAGLARVDAAIARVDVDLAKSALRAPFSGVVSARHVDVGEVVSPGQPAVRLLSVERPEARIGVSRQVAVRIEEGSAVELTVSGERVLAIVLSVLPERNTETRTVPVRFGLTASQTRLHEGDLVELAWNENETAPGFWLPRTALTEGARGLWAVYVAVPGDAAPEHGLRALERRPVEILHEDGERVYVRGALRSGDDVVQAGVHRLVPGQLTRIAGREPRLAGRAQAAGERRP